MIKKFNDQRSASEAMAEAIKSIAIQSVAERGKFVIALTGGTSPLMLHEILRTQPYLDSVPWSNCYFFWGDERVVPFNDVQNNAKMGFETLLDQVPVPKDQIFRMNSEVNATVAAKEYEAIIKQLFNSEEPAFDLILLGMGADGHTASIFPGTEVIHEKKKWVSTGYNAEQRTERITLTAPLINKAHHIFFAVFGDSKAETLKNVIQGEYRPEVLPSQLIKPESGELVWYVDEKAGRLLSL